MSTSSAGGPQPTRVDRPREAGVRVLRALAGLTEPASVNELTAVLGGHPNSIRQQLELLVEAGYVAETEAAPEGRGRPARCHWLTTAGRQAALQDEPVSDHSALVTAVAEQVATLPDPVGVARAIGRRWGRRLATGDGGELIAVLGKQGFTPRVTEDGIELLTCPLLETVRELPEVTCSIHQGLIDALATEPLELLPFALPDACLARPRQPDGSSGSDG